LTPPEGNSYSFTKGHRERGIVMEMHRRHDGSLMAGTAAASLAERARAQAELPKPPQVAGNHSGDPDGWAPAAGRSSAA
jgi:hypothetical protein